MNGTLIKLGLIDSPLSLLFNETGTVIGMVHIMLPFFVLPVFGVIRAFDWGLLQAAASLGAPQVSSSSSSCRYRFQACLPARCSYLSNALAST